MNKQSLATALSNTFHCSTRLLCVLLTHGHTLFATISLTKYIPPLESGAKLPEEPESIEEELKKQESLLNQIHKEMNIGCISKAREDLLWESQRIITQLKRKLKNTQKDSTEKPFQPGSTTLENRTEPFDEVLESKKYEIDLKLTIARHKNEGLHKLKDSLVRKIEQERTELSDLKEQLFKEYPSSGAAKMEDLSKVVNALLKENQSLQLKKINIIKKLVEEQESCLELKARIESMQS